MSFLPALPITNRILLAARMADHWHTGQFRKHKQVPYTAHLIRVAGRVAMLKDSTEDMVCAAWLHDIIEDQATSPEREQEITNDILTNLNTTVLAMVWSLTNVSKKTRAPRAERKKMDRQCLAAKPDCIKQIKLIDCIDNVREAIDDLRSGLDTNWPFAALYADESMMLLNEALTGADTLLECELFAAILLLKEVIQVTFARLKRDCEPRP